MLYRYIFSWDLPKLTFSWSLFDLFQNTITHINHLQISIQCIHTQLLPCCSEALWEQKHLNTDICHMHLAVSIEVSPMFRDTFFFFPSSLRPNQVTVNFPAVSEQASDKARPNRTDGWALFAFCCYLFMCLFFLSLSPLIQHPSILSCPSPQVPTRKRCLVTSGVICAHSNPCLQLCVLSDSWILFLKSF